MTTERLIDEIEIGIFKCNDCNKSFATTFGFLLHEDFIGCPICSKYNTKVALVLNDIAYDFVEPSKSWLFENPDFDVEQYSCPHCNNNCTCH